jgi:signal transduction histidine kinase
LPTGCFLGAYLLSSGPIHAQKFGIFILVMSAGLSIGAALDFWRVYREQKLKSARDLAFVLGLGCSLWYLVRAVQFASGDTQSANPLFGFLANVLVLANASILVALVRESEVSGELVTLLGARAEIDRLLAGLPAVVFLREVSADGASRLIYRGGDVASVTGWPAEYIAQLDDLTTLAEPGSAASSWRSKVLQGDTVNSEFRLRQPDGGWRWMNNSIRILERRTDGSTLIVGYCVSIDALRAANARAAASARLALLSDMGMGLAHELQQPLQALSLAAEIAAVRLQEGRIEVIEPQLQTIVEQTARAAAIITHLRRFARGGDGEATLRPVRLAAAINGTMAIVRGALEQERITTEVSLDGAPEFILCDPTPLEQVLVNLLLNARDALADLPSGPPRRIRVAACAGEEDEVRIIVADNGGGIPDHIMSRIFEPFFTTKGPDRGTGLGLSVSHGLMTGMGGRIEAANDGPGAVLTLVLNAAQELQDEAQPAS